MKTQPNHPHWLVSAAFLLIGLHQANAWYAPSQQRWLSRDPFEDHGFQELLSPNVARPQHVQNCNLYAFVDNSPLVKYDAWGLEPKFQGCRQKEIDAIKKALKDDRDKAKQCAGKCSSAGSAKSGVETVSDGSPTFNCVGEDFEFRDGETCKGKCARTVGSEIFMCPGAFPPSRGCGGRPGCTIFHEALHVGGLKHAKKGSKDPEPPDFNEMKKCMGCQ